MYRRIALGMSLLVMIVAMSCMAYAEESSTLAPNPDSSTIIQLPTAPPEEIDDTPITPEEQAQAEQVIAEQLKAEQLMAEEAIAQMEPSVERERAGIIMSSHRQTVGLPTEWVAVIGVGIATIITIAGIAGGRRGRRHR